MDPNTEKHYSHCISSDLARPRIELIVGRVRELYRKTSACDIADSGAIWTPEQEKNASNVRMYTRLGATTAAKILASLVR